VEDARKIFDKLAKTNPDAARTRIGLSYCDYHAGKAVSALQHFSRAQELCPEDWVVIMCSAQLSLTGIEPGRNVRVRQLTRIIDDWESKKSWLPFTLADVFKARAEQYIASSNYGKAAVDFRIARSLCPGGRLECASRYQAAFCYLRMGEYGTARLVADETIALFDKKDIDPYVAKLVTQLRWASLALSGAVDQAAKQTIERARTKRIGPSDFHQAIQYAILAGKFNDALSICRGAMDALGVHYDSIDSCYAYLLSTCPNDKARDGKLALELTEDYEQDHAENSRMLMIRSLALAETAQFDEAARVAAKAAELLPATAPLRAEYLRRSESFKKKSPFRMDARQPDFDLIERP
jgi:tetratricopeptide (TPR) repeat protein